MKKIIEKAIEGGYNLEWAKPPFSDCRDYCAIVLDNTFWQALGKACGWSEKSSIAHGNYDEIENISYEEKLTYIIHARNFHEINLTEGWDNAVAYLTSLIDEKKI